MNKKLTICLVFTLLLNLGLKAQVVVGSFYLSVMDKEYKVLIDDMGKRYKNKPVSDELKSKKIYVQVDVAELDIEAYVELKPNSAIKRVKNIVKNYNKSLSYSSKNSQFRKKIGEEEVDIYLKKNDRYTNMSYYGFESGQDFDVFIEQGQVGSRFLSYIGGTVRSEGEDGLRSQGWRLTFANKEEINQLHDLVEKAYSIIVNNRLDNNQ